MFVLERDLVKVPLRAEAALETQCVFLKDQTNTLNLFLPLEKPLFVCFCFLTAVFLFVSFFKDNCYVSLPPTQRKCPGGHRRADRNNTGTHTSINCSNLLVLPRPLVICQGKFASVKKFHIKTTKHKRVRLINYSSVTQHFTNSGCFCIFHRNTVNWLRAPATFWQQIPQAQTQHRDTFGEGPGSN